MVKAVISAMNQQSTSRTRTQRKLILLKLERRLSYAAFERKCIFACCF